MRLTLILFIILSASQSLANSVTAVPNMFYQPSILTLEHSILGSSCYSVKASQNSLDCNPALMHYNQNRQFRVNVVADKRLEKLWNYGQKIREEDVDGVVSDIIDKSEATASSLVGAMWYQHEWWAVGYSPLRIKHASNVLNPAYPQLAVSMIKESEVFLRAGVGFQNIDGLTAGVNISHLSQEYIHGQEYLFDIIANPDLSQVRKNNLLRIEPGLAYRFDEDNWKPVLSVALTHIDLYASESGYRKLPPGVEAGFSSTPEFAKGRLITSTHFSLNEPGVQPFKRLRWAGRYDFDGHYSVIANIAKGDYGVGATVAIDSLTLGAAYKSEELDYARWNSKASETLMVEAGLRF